MRPSENSQLPPEFRFHADLIACLVGILALPISGFFALNTRHSFPPGILFLLLVAAFASVAGFATVWRINKAGVKGSAVAYLVRAGARSGVFAALLAAAMLVLGVRLFVSQAAAIGSLFPTMLSILPGGFFGMLVAASAAGVRIPKLPNATSAPESKSRSLLITPLLVVVSIIGFLSVLVPLHRGVLLSQSVTPFTSAPSAPSWHYETPELSNAEAAQWQVAATRLLPRTAPNAPIAISPDGNSLAYLDFNKALRVIDLKEPDHFSVFPLNYPARKLSFSPDGRRLIFETDAQLRGFGVVDLNKSGITYLPKPISNLIPDGDLVWFSPTEVVFQTDSPPIQILDLDSLELKDSSASDALSKLSDTDRTHLTSAQPVTLPSTAHCTFEFRPALTMAEIPSDQEWRVNTESRLCIKDLAHPYRQFSSLDAAINDRFIGASDGTKLIRIRGTDLLAIYFNTRPTPAVMFNLVMPKPSDQYLDKEKLASAISAGELCALVYQPLLNPLNQKVIGPYRGYVKGLVRFSAWTGTQASVWLAEEFTSIGSDDVISDLHLWKGNRPDLIGDPEARGWWSKIGTVTDDQHNIANLPADQDTKPLDHTVAYSMATEANTVVIKNIDSQPSAESGSPQDSAATATAPAPPPQVDQDEGRMLGPTEPEYQVVTQFIAAHHLKANSGDLNALVNDYADRVRYFKNGIVDRSFIFRDETISRAKFRTMAERIIAFISIREHRQPLFKLYDVHYQIAYEAISKKDNRRITGTSDVYLDIVSNASGLRISSQRSQL